MILDLINNELKRLRRETNYALEAAFVVKKQFDGDAINWADLHCICAETYLTDAGIVGYRVHVEEAAPNSNKLAMWVSEHLQSKGFGDEVEVVTEW